jgi:hypothetical protein
MELLLGVVGDFWTPRAAQQALWVVSQMTPKKAEELFERIGNMQPSKSSIGRLPKLLSERWEEHQGEFEKALRDGLAIPDVSVSIAVSLDSVHAPVDGGQRPGEVRAQAARPRGASARAPRATARRGALRYRSVTTRAISSARSAWRVRRRRRSPRGRQC